MQLKLTKAEFMALKNIANLNAENTNAEAKAKAEAEVKNLIAKADIQNGAVEKSIAQKFYEDLAFGRKAVSTGSDTTGGSLVPVEVSTDIIETLPQYSFAFQKCKNVQMKSLQMKITSVGNGVSISWVDEANAGADTSITWTPINLVAKKMLALAIISNEELDNAVVDVAGLVQKVIVSAIGKEADRVIFAGQAGVFTGLKTQAGVNAVSVSKAGADTAIADALIDLQFALPNYALSNGGIYATSLAGWGKMRKLKGSDGHYLARSVNPQVDGNKALGNSSASPVGTFDGREVYIINAGVDDFSTTGNVPVYFGDFATFFVVGINKDMEMYLATEGTIGAVSLLATDQKAIRCKSQIAYGNIAGAFARLSLLA